MVIVPRTEKSSHDKSLHSVRPCKCVGGSAGGTHIPCANMQCDSGCVLTIIRIHERQRSLPLPIHPSLGETKDSAEERDREKGDRGETAGLVRRETQGLGGKIHTQKKEREGDEW